MGDPCPMAGPAVTPEPDDARRFRGPMPSSAALFISRGIGAVSGTFSAFASTSATNFCKSTRPRGASKSGSLSSLGMAQPV